MVEEGKPAPDFELTSDGRETAHVSDFRGKPVVDLTSIRRTTRAAINAVSTASRPECAS